MKFKRFISLLKSHTIRSTLFFTDNFIIITTNFIDKASLYTYNRYMRVPVGQMIEWTYNPKMDSLLGLITEYTERGYIVHWNLGHKIKKSEVSIYEMSEALMAGNYKIVLDK